MYSFITEESHESENLKGINKNVVDDELKHEDYKNVLFNRSYLRHEMNRTQSKDHNLGPYRIIFLSFYNDKKYILEDGYIRLSHFHKLALVRTAILFSFFPRYNIYHFLCCSTIHKRRLFSQENGK